MNFVCEARLFADRLFNGAIVLGEEKTETGSLAPTVLLGADQLGSGIGGCSTSEINREFSGREVRRRSWGNSGHRRELTD